MTALVIFSPLPPLRNGIGDYSARLVREFSKTNECVIVIANDAPEPDDPLGRAVVIRDAEYRSLRHRFAGCLHVFHLGNNSDCVYMVDHLLHRAAIIILHDLSLHHMVEGGRLQGGLSEGRYRRLHHASRGALGAVIHRAEATHDWKTPSNYVEMYFVKPLLSRAMAVVVHSNFGMVRVAGECPHVRVRKIAHFAEIPTDPRGARRQRARRILGLDPRMFIYLSLGFINAAKRIDDVLRALALLKKNDRRFLYVIVGAGGETFARTVADMGLADSVLIVGYCEAHLIEAYLDATDVLINLRYPTLGETSGTLCRALARGVCAIVSDHGWFGEIPADAALKMRAWPIDALQLSTLLLLLLERSDLRQGFERRGAEFAARTLALPGIVASYQELFDSMSREAGPQDDARLGELFPVVLAEDATRSAMAQRIRGLDKADVVPWRGIADSMCCPDFGRNACVSFHAPTVIRDVVVDVFGYRPSGSEEEASGGFFLEGLAAPRFDAQLRSFVGSLADGSIAFLDLWSERSDWLEERPLEESLSSFDLEMLFYERCLSRFIDDVLVFSVCVLVTKGQNG